MAGSNDANRPGTIVIQQRGGRWLGRIGWILAFILLMMVISQQSAYDSYFSRTGGVIEKYHSGAKTGKNKIAVIHVSGVIMSGDKTIRQIERVREDRDVRAIVLRVNSPGGTITGSDAIYHYLNVLRLERNLPVVVSMGAVAASGGYYVSMAAGKGENLIFAEPTTTTGSIGVIMPHYDATKLLEKIGVADDSVVSHPLKELGSMTKPMSEAERKILQDYVNDSFGRFKRIVLESRPQLKGAAPLELKHAKTGDDVATGQIFTASQALDAGLVDKIGFIEDAITRARDLAGLSESNTRVIEYKQPVNLFGLFGESAASWIAPSTRRPSSRMEIEWDALRLQPYYLMPSAAHLPLAGALIEAWNSLPADRQH